MKTLCEFLSTSISTDLVRFTNFRIITAELDGAVVKVTLQVSGNIQFSGGCPKNYWGIKIKSGTNNYVGEGNPHAKFGNIEITGVFSPYSRNITFRTSANNFVFNVMLIFEQCYR